MTGSTIAYGLRADHEPDGAEPFGGGLIRIGFGRDLNIADALKAGKGRIIIAANDHEAVAALDAYTPLKRVPAGNAAPTVTRWADQTTSELTDELKLRDLPTTGAKDQLVERLVEHDAAVATGISTPRPAVTAKATRKTRQRRRPRTSTPAPAPPNPAVEPKAAAAAGVGNAAANTTPEG